MGERDGGGSGRDGGIGSEGGIEGSVVLHRRRRRRWGGCMGDGMAVAAAGWEMGGGGGSGSNPSTLGFNVTSMEGIVSVFPSRTQELLTTRLWDFLGFPQTIVVSALFLVSAISWDDHKIMASASINTLPVLRNAALVFPING
nr:unnamed protein product [Digitaria exilis]